ncbi:hybrid sensor histidine kinase/response regulator [Aquabacterium sp.]|uniref:hybrid sensor histidine kinase/response regulator n=1 Tax=Aquabacterium sp. TaxID=1872578 RepID=UPI002BCC8FF4|nr:response regulator [Aquabacterium sp.]HSW06792.1 response regulator [Aquabacterium sp.]
MTPGDESFLKRLLETFKVEAREHLEAMSALLLELDRQPSAESVEALFREAHSLKGAARAVNRAAIEDVCRALERLLSPLKRQGLAPPADWLPTFERCVDGLARMLAEIGDTDATARAAVLAAELVSALERLAARQMAAETAAEMAATAATAPAERTSKEMTADLPAAQAAGPAARAAPLEAAPPAPAGATVRISTARLEALLVQAEELLAFKFGTDHLAEELGALGSTVADWRRNSAERTRHLRLMRRSQANVALPLCLTPSGGPDAKRQVWGHSVARPRAAQPSAGPPDRGGRLLARWLEATERDELLVRSLGDRFAQLERVALRERHALGSMVDRLQDEMKQALMLPFTSLLELAPKLLRDLARDSGKEVELVTQGTAIEIDRRILEQMKAPLIHLLRNAMDHGIEPPDERRRLGKPACGRIRIEVTPREGNKVEMTLEDDGRGIAVHEVKARALKMGLLPAPALDELPAAQAMGLVFESGLSTSPLLTDLSGHGLGLAIAREKVDKLGGSLTLQERPGGGTRFCIVLPLALATYRGLLVTVGERPFVLPSRNVERVLRVKPAAIRVMANREAIELDGQALSLVRLHELLALAPPAAARGLASVTARGQAADAPLPVVLLSSGDKRIAFVVDEILGDQEVLVKPLRAPLKRVRHVAGATILGAGRVVPLLDVADLMKSAQSAGLAAGASAPGSSATAQAQAALAAGATLLVVEDSITSRTLLRGILESAGYRVHTAVDGLDALNQLNDQAFDLVISDVEMPRLDGFGLTTRLRADARLAELPVVLLTALASSADRQRGIEVGANAYIVKGGFEQDQLLEAIRSLL